MNCEQIEQRLQELLDSRQTIDSDDELREHVELCAECAKLATAYDALSRQPTFNQPHQPLAGLASRVVAEVSAVSPAKPQATWRTWSALTIAASLLVGVGLILRDDNQNTPTDTDQPLAVIEDPEPEDVVAAADEPPQALPREVAGREMWYRTGRGLASISLASLRSQRTVSSEAESQSEQQLLDRAFHTIRSLLPGVNQGTLPTNGETGWRGERRSVLVV